MSTYVTYADSLQQGDTAPAGASNAGNILDPYRSKQWEIGYKVAVGDMHASLAAFRITRPYAYVTGNQFAIAGEHQNDGVEFMLDGHVARDLTLFGGVTWLDPRLNDTGNATTEGRRIVGLPRYALSLLATYDVRQVPGLSTRLTLRAVDARAGDNTNLNDVADYGTLDWSAAYRTQVAGYATTFRLAVNNLTDKQYWTNVVPGGQCRRDDRAAVGQPGRGQEETGVSQSCGRVPVGPVRPRGGVAAAMGGQHPAPVPKK
jgi:iron complex outermembrane receptor protein